ncbi:FecR family protein [Parapedobacter indicus]|uniref:FecR family protein n=1 Tax=Parapedobacter indicus TaxID=1477437 RepID=A0A1I3H3T5_9SPHI|nr:FecR family protein [Parapedobacter indicus]PPL02884.1 FecR family protein [Parapedobacter indicus]SFI30220.1 FecR family protein [Parapedobacter indicus]
MDEQHHLRALFEKYLNGECTEQEVRELFMHLHLLDDDTMLRQFVQSAFDEDRHIELLYQHKLAALTARVEKRLGSNLPQQQYRFDRFLLSKRLMTIAAVLLAILSIGIILYNWEPKTGKTGGIAVTEVDDVLPGGNRATLTLSDGRTIQLSTEQAGIVVGDGISYLDGSSVLGKQGNRRTNEQGHSLTLTTPKGGTYQVTLSDGTKVWLNAASSLSYPSRFDERERVVELTGEAYFDVSEQVLPKTMESAGGDSHKIPFRVITKGQAVEVLGTQFNIAAYSEEEKTLTTLVEGAVRVTPSEHGRTGRRNRQHTVLKPGQQSIVKDTEVTINQVDVSLFINWKNGLFSFKETELHEVMQQLGRWYDVDIVYAGEIPEAYFFGDIRRDRSLTQALTILKKSGVNFTIDKKGKRVRLIVLP